MCARFSINLCTVLDVAALTFTSVVFDPVPALRELRVLYSQMEILLKQLKGAPSVAKEKQVPDVLFEKLASPIVALQFFQGRQSTQNLKLIF